MPRRFPSPISSLDSRRVGPARSSWRFVAIRWMAGASIEQAVAQERPPCCLRRTENSSLRRPRSPASACRIFLLVSPSWPAISTVTLRKSCNWWASRAPTAKAPRPLLVANWRTLLGQGRGHGHLYNGLFGELIEAENTTGSAVQVGHLAASVAAGADSVAMEGLQRSGAASCGGVAVCGGRLYQPQPGSSDYHGTMEVMPPPRKSCLKWWMSSCVRACVLNGDDHLGTVNGWRDPGCRDLSGFMGPRKPCRVVDGRRIPG